MSSRSWNKFCFKRDHHVNGVFLEDDVINASAGLQNNFFVKQGATSAEVYVRMMSSKRGKNNHHVSKHPWNQFLANRPPINTFSWNKLFTRNLRPFHDGLNPWINLAYHLSYNQLSLSWAYNDRTFRRDFLTCHHCLHCTVSHKPEARIAISGCPKLRISSGNTISAPKWSKNIPRRSKFRAGSYKP